MQPTPPSDEVQLEHVRRGLDTEGLELLAGAEAGLARALDPVTGELRSEVDVAAASATLDELVDATPPERRFNIVEGGRTLEVYGGGPQLSAAMPHPLELKVIEVEGPPVRRWVLARPVKVRAGDRFLYVGPPEPELVQVVRVLPGRGFYAPAAIQLLEGGPARVSLTGPPAASSLPGQNRAARRRVERERPRWQRR